MMKNRVKSMRGEVLDMSALAAKNGTTIALGNAKMNARGDIIDRSGNIVKTRDAAVLEYYNNNPQAVTKTVSLKDIGDEVMTPQQVIAELDKKQNSSTDTSSAPKKKKIVE